MKFIKQGDIFESSCEVIANPINCVGVMGGGLALAFKKKFPKHFETYKKMCQNGEIKVGELYVVDGDEKHKVLLFPTKIHWKNPSLMEYVESGLEYLAKNYDKLGIKSVAIPALGCDFETFMDEWSVYLLLLVGWVIVVGLIGLIICGIIYNLVETLIIIGVIAGILFLFLGIPYIVYRIANLK